MPGSMVHLIVQQRMTPLLMEMRPEVGALLSSEPGSPYTALGSVGPDFLFFSLKEWGEPLSELTNFFFRIYDALEPFVEFYEENVKPVEQDLENALLNADKTLFKGLIQQLRETANQMQATLINEAATIVTKQVDFFYPFFPRVQRQQYTVAEWYWFDMLHIRRTGQFCANMWKLAQGDADLMRYCAGYASHIATDVVGHPFVNAVVGGPYRTHWHRHKLVENWIDAYARNHYPDPVGVKDALKLKPEEKYADNAISGSYYYRLCEFPEEKLPDKLQSLLTKAMQMTYQKTDHPAAWLTDADVDSAYRLWLEYFKRTTVTGDARKPDPVPPPGGAAAALLLDCLKGFPSPPSSQNSGSKFSLKNILAAIYAYLKWAGDCASYSWDWLLNHIDEIFALPFADAIALLKYLLYKIQLALWIVYDDARWLLVLAGYLNPEPRDLLKSPYANALLNTDYAHTTGGDQAEFSLYPRREPDHKPADTTHHLAYPQTKQEEPHAEPAPLPFHGRFPEIFISEAEHYAGAEGLFDCTAPYGPGSTDEIDENTWQTGQFGNAIWFSAQLIRQIEKIPNFSLDGDRGYGWKCWTTEDDLQNASTIITATYAQ